MRASAEGNHAAADGCKLAAAGSERSKAQRARLHLHQAQIIAAHTDGARAGAHALAESAAIGEKRGAGIEGCDRAIGLQIEEGRWCIAEDRRIVASDQSRS